MMWRESHSSENGLMNVLWGGMCRAPVDFRQRVIAAIDGGSSCRQAAEHFGVSAASAIRWHGRLKEAGDIAPKRQGGDRKS
jgi:transposase